MNDDDFEPVTDGFYYVRVPGEEHPTILRVHYRDDHHDETQHHLVVYDELGKERDLCEFEWIDWVPIYSEYASLVSDVHRLRAKCDQQQIEIAELRNELARSVVE